jgi:SAM-dependent methyltransferase
MTATELIARQVGVEHYDWSAYNDHRRWASYWHQIDEVMKLRPRSCLVVGPGEGTVVDVLRRAQIDVTTCDIDPELAPDVIASVEDLPFENRMFDVVLCAQVLEHLPYDQLGCCLAEIARVGGGNAVISIPTKGRSWEFAFWLSPLPRVHLGGKFPARTNHVFDGQHYWELGARNYPRHAVEQKIKEIFTIRRQFQVAENPFHRFYILGPKSR